MAKWIIVGALPFLIIGCASRKADTNLAEKETSRMAFHAARAYIESMHLRGTVDDMTMTFVRECEESKVEDLRDHAAAVYVEAVRIKPSLLPQALDFVNRQRERDGGDPMGLWKAREEAMRRAAKGEKTVWR